MFDAVLQDDLAAVKRHVEAGAEVAWRNPRGLTAAEFAVEIGHIEIANYLLAEERAQAGRPARTAADKGPAKAAKKAAGVNVKSSPGQSNPNRTLDDDLREIARKHYGT